LFENGRPTILITGATSGIGQATAELMVKNGCRRPNVPVRIRDPKQTSNVYNLSIGLCGLEPL